MKKVIVYCASGYASKVTYLLDDEKYDVIAWADSNPETWSGMSIWGGHNVISPDKINDYEFDLIIVSVSEYFDTIKRDLVEKYNIDSDKIIAYQPNEKGIKWLDERISVLRKCIDVIKERNIQGEMAELGVYKGDFSRLLNKYLPDKKIYLFDTFNGFCSTRDTVNTEDLEVFKDTSVQYVLSRMEHPEKCIVKKGYFPDTTDGVDEKFALVSLDCDLYEPILAGLEYFYPRMTPGGLIMVHDFDSYHYAGTKKAVYEYCNKQGIGIVALTDRCGTAVIVKNR